MPLFEIGETAIIPVAETSFSLAGIRERADLQRLLRQHISIISPNTLIVAEEFGSWDASYRRIDLLGIDKAGNLVVIELKRDDTGAHMELQALRYAAMVARMTFDEVVTTYSSFLATHQPDVDARSALLQHLAWDEPDESGFGQKVRIVLVAADFSRELTTSVLWLNEGELDIRCVRLQPYRFGGKLLVNAEQVVPLPEASDYQIQIRDKARKERSVAGGGADWTRYDLVAGTKSYEYLPKRRLAYHAARHLVDEHGATPEQITEIIKYPRAWASVEGLRDSVGFADALVKQAEAGGPQLDPRRFFCADDEIFHANGRTYAFTKGWGTNTLPALEAMKAAFPKAVLQYQPNGEDK